jgi:sulfur-carrier protein
MIEVKFFASLREQLGKEQVTLEANNTQNVLAVWVRASGGLKMPDNTLCAINMEYVKPDAPVADNDEVAFFPPVTGG